MYFAWAQKTNDIPIPAKHDYEFASENKQRLPRS